LILPAPGISAWRTPQLISPGARADVRGAMARVEKYIEQRGMPQEEGWQWNP